MSDVERLLAAHHNGSTVPLDPEPGLDAEELRQRLVGEIQTIQAQLADPIRSKDRIWRSKAIKAMNHRQGQLRAVKVLLRRQHPKLTQLLAALEAVRSEVLAAADADEAWDRVARAAWG